LVRIESLRQNCAHRTNAHRDRCAHITVRILPAAEARDIALSTGGLIVGTIRVNRVAHHVEDDLQPVLIGDAESQLDQALRNLA
jgi:20S proteasome alpha/beta subunit